MILRIFAALFIGLSVIADEVRPAANISAAVEPDFEQVINLQGLGSEESRYFYLVAGIWYIQGTGYCKLHRTEGGADPILLGLTSNYPNREILIPQDGVYYITGADSNNWSINIRSALYHDLNYYSRKSDQFELGPGLYTIHGDTAASFNGNTATPINVYHAATGLFVGRATPRSGAIVKLEVPIGKPQSYIALGLTPDINVHWMGWVRQIIEGEDVVILELFSENLVPIAATETYIVEENASVNIVLTARDPDGERIRDFNIVEDPKHGRAIQDTPVMVGDAGYPPPTGTLVEYRPQEGFSGIDSLRFTALDGMWFAGTSEPATIYFEVQDNSPQWVSRNAPIEAPEGRIFFKAGGQKGQTRSFCSIQWHSRWLRYTSCHS